MTNLTTGPVCIDCGHALALDGEAVCMDCWAVRDAADHYDCDCETCWRARHDAATVHVSPRGLSEFGLEVLGWSSDDATHGK